MTRIILQRTTVKVTNHLKQPSDSFSHLNEELFGEDNLRLHIYRCRPYISLIYELKTKAFKIKIKILWTFSIVKNINQQHLTL